MQSLIDQGQTPDVSLVTLSQLPNPVVSHYNSMYAYGNHFRVDDEARRGHVSFDSGVACIAIQMCRSSRADRDPVEAALKYVGIVKDILQVEYGHIKYVTLKCSWIKPDVEGTPTIRTDEHGFWSVKFAACQTPPVEPYLMPCHAKQMSPRILLASSCSSTYVS